MSQMLSLVPGAKRTPLESESRAPASPFIIYSDDYFLPESGGLIISINVTDVSGGGSLNKLRVMAKHGSTYVKVIEFTGLSITATGLYLWRIIPGASASSSWKGVASDMPPVEGRIEVEHTDANAIVYSMKLQCIKA